jgi:hypothetical protein
MTGSRIGDGEVQVGLALPWDLCDESGRLLLRQGFVVDHAAQLRRLLDAGLYRRAPGVKPDIAGRSRAVLAAPRASCTVFARVDAILVQLEALLTGAPTGGFPGRVLALADAVQECFALDPDAAIATIQLLSSRRYSIRRLVHAAILTELLLTHEGAPQPERLVALAAALTMNIAILDLQDRLNHQTTPPDAAQTQQLRAHPEAGVLALRSLGVDDMRWLSTVAQHHETIDGKGYPRALAAESVGRHAQILSMVDRYGSMAIGRAYRAPVLPNVVLKQIFMDKQSVDPRLAALLVSAVGMYPPGSLVALASGELAVVLRRSAVASQPLVYCLRGARGERLDPPLRRLTSEPAFAIARLVSNAELGFAIEAGQLWDEAFDMAALPD